MAGLVGRTVELLRKRGPIGLLRSARWYVTASRVPAPFRKRPELLRRYIAFRRRLQPDRFTDAHPFKVLRVDPARVGEAVRAHGAPLSFGRVKGGDWDEERTPFDDRLVPRAVEARVREDAPWVKTALYEQLLETVSGGGVAYGCRTETELRQHFAAVDDLIESMEADSYRTQRELLARDPESAWAETERDRGGIHPRLNEIGVNVGRDGRLLWRHRGEHRLAIARSLGIDEVAVQVLTRHADWQAVRDAYRQDDDPNGRQADDSDGHPDLQDLLT